MYIIVNTIQKILFYDKKRHIIVYNKKRGDEL